MSNGDFPATQDCLAQVTFLIPPQSTPVFKGGDAAFQRAGEENATALLFDWDFTPNRGMRIEVVTGTTVAGVSMVTISIDTRYYAIVV